MTMDAGELFPPTPRVFYRQAPLIQVIGQVQFPQILRIGKDVPSEFQERIRDKFPLFERQMALRIPLPTPPIAPTSRPQQSPLGGPTTAYQFHTEDKSATIELTSDSVSFSTRRYTVWEAFRSDLHLAINAAAGVYRPSYYTRVGLRYQDLIVRSRLGVEGVPWSRLFRPEVMGELSNPHFEKCLIGAFRVLNLRMPSDSESIVIQHGLATAVGGTEVGYTVDLDFSLDKKTKVSDVGEILERLHGSVGRAFRWFITDELHGILDPAPFEDNKDAVPGNYIISANG